MEEILSQAKEKGLFVVNSEESTLERIESDYQNIAEKVDRLCDVVDPDEKPFQSKYEARDLLDEYLKQLEATKTIATLENKVEVVDKLKQLIAQVQTRLGSISWDCEEPHNAQTDLEMACNFYFPNLIVEVESLVGQKDELLSSASDSINPLEAAENVTPPNLPELRNTSDYFDAMKCLNLLGILWAGRGQPLKSLYYLLAANSCYDKFHRSVTLTPSPSAKFAKDMENIFTHNLFYLAQAYGNLKSMKKSSDYCHQTLQRQLSLGLADIKSALDWVKNCCGIADYYLATQQYFSCSCALLSAERVLKEKVIVTLYEEMERQMPSSETANGKANPKPNFVQGNLNAAEIEADLHRRFAILDVQILKQAAQRFKELQAANSMGVDPALVSSQYVNQEDNERYSALKVAQCVENEKEKIAFFDNLWISVLPLVRVDEVSTFEDARKVFLRAAARIESAKKYYVLDGYVTDHVTLLQEHSKLFHHLNTFESDYKRKLAMENRRIELLGPIIKSLNIVSYEVLHKQISYELGETALALLDLKLDKLRGDAGVIDEKSLKKAEISKCNEYAKQACVFFGHFTFLYAQSKDRKIENTISVLEGLPLYDLVKCFCSEPDESLISEEEVRPFLNANFLSCRVMSKVIAHSTSLPPPSLDRSRAFFLIACLQRYEWIVRFAPKICERRGLNLQEVFGEEFQISQDMVKLLPSKIDRMCYLGESGLSL